MKLYSYTSAIEEEHQLRFLKETRELLHRRVIAALWIGIILIPLFSVLDYMIVRQYFSSFLIARLICSLLFIALLVLHYQQFGREHPFVIAILAYVLAGITISFMVIKMGGYDSFYYVGIILVLVTCSTILPLDAMQSTFAGLLLYLIYAVPIFLFCERTNDSMMVFFNNSFFFASFIVISIIQCLEDTNARVGKFNMEMELDSHAKKLAYYAEHLETEVDKRAKELEDSELRYRNLYENIIDMVILVDRHGQLLLANPLFYSNLCISNITDRNVSIKDWVHEDDVLLVRNHIFSRLEDGGIVKNLNFRIVSRDGRVFDVECNAKGILKNKKLAGLQMVIRDITERKRLEKELLDSMRDVQNARTCTILGLAKLAECRDMDTGVHLERIGEYTKIIIKEISTLPAYQEYISQQYIDDIYLSSILHDIGKVGIPDAILSKPGKLTPEEFDVMKRHTTFGGDALRAVETHVKGQSFLALGKAISYYHHEKWNGDGYPEGLKGEDIPLSARIVALVDVYDALTSRRSYKEAYSHEKSKEIIVNERGKHFAPDIVDAFIATEEQFNAIRQQLQQ